MNPTEDEVLRIIEVIKASFQELLHRDGSLFVPKPNEIPQMYEGQEELERKLHEVAINHRFAFYLECNIRHILPDEYSVDMEYNRYYNSRKMLHTAIGLREVRPDILVHTRTNDAVQPQHYLAVEAKKGRVADYDRDKIESFLTDAAYRYHFGLTISYCESDKHILGELYYRSRDDQIRKNSITVSKR